MIYVMMLLGAATSALLLWGNGWTNHWVDILLFLGFGIVFFAAWIVIYMGILYIASLFMGTTKERKKPCKFSRFIMEETLSMLLFFQRVHIHAEGMDLIPKDTRFLMVANHLSNYDPISSIVKLRKFEISFISKPENFKIPIAGAFMHTSGFMAIDRENVKNALVTINRGAEYIKNNEESIAIFPEGTRNRTQDKLLEFRNGAFKVATKAKCPIVVVAFKNTNKVAQNFPWKRTDIILKVVEVIPAEVVAVTKTAEISEKVRELLLQNV